MRHAWDKPADSFERTCARCGAVVRKYDGQGGYQYWPKGLEYRSQHFPHGYVSWIPTIPECTVPRLTKGQENALALLDSPDRMDGKLYAFCGVSLVTARKLVELGICEWAPEPHPVTPPRRRPGGRLISQVEWGIRRKPVKA